MIDMGMKVHAPNIYIASDKRGNKTACFGLPYVYRVVRCCGEHFVVTGERDRLDPPTIRLQLG
jgi:hypothetical protein